MEQEERKTINTVDICSCGLVMHQLNSDDYDTLGADSPICCPDCGNDRFLTVAELIKQRDALQDMLEKIANRKIKHKVDSLLIQLEAKKAITLCEANSQTSSE